ACRSRVKAAALLVVAHSDSAPRSARWRCLWLARVAEVDSGDVERREHFEALAEGGVAGVADPGCSDEPRITDAPRDDRVVGGARGIGDGDDAGVPWEWFRVPDRAWAAAGRGRVEQDRDLEALALEAVGLPHARKQRARSRVWLSDDPRDTGQPLEGGQAGHVFRDGAAALVGTRRPVARRR